MKPYLLSLAALLLLCHVAGSSYHRCGGREAKGALKVFHSSSPCSSPGSKLSLDSHVARTQARDAARAEMLTSLQAVSPGVPVASGRLVLDTPLYIVFAQVGTPPQTLLMALDTASDAAWIPCTGCKFCTSYIFDTSASSSFFPLSCDAAECSLAPNSECGVDNECRFNEEFSGSVIFSNLVQDTVTLGADVLPSYTLGCITNTIGVNVPPQGVLGLGRGALSLASQGRSLFKSTFSYCLPSILSFNFTGSLRLGRDNQPFKIRSTPLLFNPRKPSLYYLKLSAIKYGGKVLDIPQSAFQFSTQTGAGTVLDTGTAYTMLVPEAYQVLRDAFRKRVGARNVVVKRGSFDTCYGVPIESPKITFVFSGFNLVLPPENFLIQTAYGNVTCLAIVSTPANADVAMNVIGSMQQQNYRVLVDVPRARVGFSREDCSTPILV